MTMTVLRVGGPVQIVQPRSPFHGMCGVLDRTEVRRSGGSLHTIAWVIFGRVRVPVEFPASAVTPVVARPGVPRSTA
jgi:hypothetical protein